MIAAVVISIVFAFNIAIPVNKAVLGKLIDIILTAADTDMPYISFFFRGNFTQVHNIKTQFIFNIAVVITVNSRYAVGLVAINRSSSVNAYAFRGAERIKKTVSAHFICAAAVSNAKTGAAAA